ncbi:Os11g0205800, partial [Oryza sativa Japonica Group]
SFYFGVNFQVGPLEIYCALLICFFVQFLVVRKSRFWKDMTMTRTKWRKMKMRTLTKTKMKTLLETLTKKKMKRKTKTNRKRKMFDAPLF